MKYPFYYKLFEGFAADCLLEMSQQLKRFTYSITTIRRNTYGLQLHAFDSYQ